MCQKSRSWKKAIHFLLKIAPFFLQERFWRGKWSSQTKPVKNLLKQVYLPTIWDCWVHTTRFTKFGKQFPKMNGGRTSLSLDYWSWESGFFLLFCLSPPHDNCSTHHPITCTYQETARATSRLRWHDETVPNLDFQTQNQLYNFFWAAFGGYAVTEHVTSPPSFYQKHKNSGASSLSYS